MAGKPRSPGQLPAGTNERTKMKSHTLLGAAIAGIALCVGTALAQMAHHHGDNPKCTGTGLACATQVTPTFAADGTLWVVWAANGTVSVARSHDLGRTFSTAVAVNSKPLDLDWGPDSRPSIVVDKDGRVFVAFARFRNSKFDGEVLFSRSLDGGKSFAAPKPITDNPESQRFQALALDANGSLFAAWLDKRDRVPAAARGQKYVGAGLAFAWSNDHGATFTAATIAHDNTCECCRLGVGIAGTGRPVVAFRNVFGGTVRDHAVITFLNPQTPGPLYRVSVDDWKIDACPHQGPTLAIAPDGTYHIAWFTEGSVRQGVFYASSSDGGRSFSQPVPIGDPKRNPARPYLLATKDALWLVWKEFDGESTAVKAMRSRDDGHTWSAPKVVTQTDDASDHPLLVSNGERVYLSWQTRAEGYRLIALENSQ
jgi:hypothetical protein